MPYLDDFKDLENKQDDPAGGDERKNEPEAGAMSSGFMPMYSNKAADGTVKRHRYSDAFYEKVNGGKDDGKQGADPQS